MTGAYILRTPARPGQMPGEPAQASLHPGQQLELFEKGHPAALKVLRFETSGLLVVQWGTRIVSGIARICGGQWELQVLGGCAPRALRVRPAAVDTLEQATRAHGGPNGSIEVPSPIPGLVKQLKVKIGDQVEAGQTLLILEAMKMENELPAPCAGVVQSIEVKSGQTVAAGEILLKLKS